MTSSTTSIRGTILVGLLAALLLSGCAAQRPADIVRASGDRAFTRGDFKVAAAEYQEIADRYPGDWEAQYKLGLSWIEAGEPEEAISPLKIAYDRRPDREDVVEARAEALYRAKAYARLYTFLAERAQARQTVDEFLRLAEYSAAMQDPDSAHRAIEEAIRLSGGRSVDAFLAAADLEITLGDMDRAVGYLRRAYALDPSNARVVSGLRTLGEIPGPTLSLQPDG